MSKSKHDAIHITLKQSCVVNYIAIKLEEKTTLRNLTILYILPLKKKKCMERVELEIEVAKFCGIVIMIFDYSVFLCYFIVFFLTEAKSIFH